MDHSSTQPKSKIAALRGTPEKVAEALRASPEIVVDALKASHLREVISEYAEALKARRKGIDSLNVYPVPDGDTGTNMSLTVQSVVAELKSAAADDMGAIAGAISRGAILGARGNSGAILAQALRGLAESVKGKASITPEDLAQAFEKARHSAYESVLKPVEGTILTVLTAAATAARKAADEGRTLKEQLDHIRIASAEALARTPELLPVLKSAGVVDAGGSGFLLFVDALRYVATGEPIPGMTDAPSSDETLDLRDVHSEISELRYEVMFLMDAADDRIRDFRQAWSEVGDSIVVVGGDGLWNCHIHSDDVGRAIEVALDYGRPKQIRVTDLQEQAGALHGTGDEALSELPPVGEVAFEVAPVNTAVVAVVSGDGVKDIYRSFGVTELVSGGQSSNPSVAELLAAVEAAPSQSVIILPNNKNVHAAARAVDDLTDKTVAVIPTRSIVEGMAALVCYDSASSVDELISAMTASASGVVCGEVTQAVRDSDSAAGRIREGDWLGIGPDGIGVVRFGSGEALIALVEHLLRDGHEILTIVRGEGADDADLDQLQQWLASRPGLELELHDGGQPLYPYLVGLE